MAFFLLGVPLAFHLAVLRPALARMDLLRRRLDEISQEMKVPPSFTPVQPGERALLEDPAAPWRRRMPVVATEQARLAHYDRVVGALQRTWRAEGTPALGLRSSWDPIHASFTLPAAVAGGPGPYSPAQDHPDLLVHGWVVEARFAGGSELLFKALGAVPRVEPLMEPVGLRWASTATERQQSLILRNLVVH